MNEQPLLEVREVVSGYGDLNILNGVNLVVNSGAIVTLIGSNGSGKSTALKTIIGLLQARSGDILFNGHSLTQLATEDIVARGIGYVPQIESIFPQLSVREHFFLSQRKMERTVADKALEFFPQLKSRLNVRGAVLSGGERQMLGIARALALNPRLLLLDEPSAALAPQIVDMMFDRIRTIAASGIAILLVEQNVKAALRLSDYAYALQMGKVALEGPGPDLLIDPRLEAVYLGQVPNSTAVSGCHTI